MADESEASRFQAKDMRPVPDPTELTRLASDRLEGMLRQHIDTEVAHLDELTQTRLTAEAEISKQRFILLDARTAEQKQDTTNALNAALAAQKEAVAAQTASSEKSITKSETATTERIKGVETLLQTSSKATDDKISDLKERIVAIESLKLGANEALDGRRVGAMDARSVVALGISGVFLLIAIITTLATFIKP